MMKKKIAEKEQTNRTLASLQEACIKAGDGRKLILAYAQGYAAAQAAKESVEDKPDEAKEKE